MLTQQDCQEALSLAYIRAVAARCGMTAGVPDKDYGTDIVLYDIDRRHGRYFETGFALRIQAKSTTAAEPTPGEIRYDLDVKNYEDLRYQAGRDWRAPFVLVLFVMPPGEDEWLSLDETELRLRGCCYWLSLAAHPPTANKRTVRVAIPRTNRFTPDGLRRIMDGLRTGGRFP